MDEFFINTISHILEQMVVVVVGLNSSLTRFPVQVQDIMSSPTSRALPDGHGSHAPPDVMKKFSAHSSEEPRIERETRKSSWGVVLDWSGTSYRRLGFNKVSRRAYSIIDSLSTPAPEPPRM